jgi:predicted RNase H-like HicB family nuclease
MKYLVQMEEDKESGGFVVWCPTLSGCVSQGETREEALENIKDAILLYLDSMKDLERQENLLTVEVGA